MVGRPAVVGVPRIWIAFSIPIAMTMGVSSAAGAFGRAYARETPSWAAQGAGQDLANLFIVVPLLVVAAALAGRGSFRALLVWTGVLLYVVYSYVLYALYVHFNAMFLLYVATLGFAFYALVGTVLTADRSRLTASFETEKHTGVMSVVLGAAAILFTAAWMVDIVPALVHGTAPSSVADTGFPVNPIHVLDLAFALPGVFATAVLVRRRNVFGLLMAIPCAIFLVVMGIAILAMAWMMSARGISGAGGFPVPVAITVAAAAYATYRYLLDLTPTKT